MGNKLFIILLSAILSYTANASNETVQGINTDDNYNRIQLREQLATAWQNIQPEVTLTINQENPQITNNSNTENNQDKYIIISINPGFFHTPTPEIGAADSFLEVKSIVPFRTELAQDIEAGLGLRKGALRFEGGGLRWIRFHASNNLDETIFWENLDIAYLNDRNILPNPYAFDALDALFYRFGHGEIVDNLGIVGGIVYDIQIANENVFYVGGKIGALRASLGHITSGINMTGQLSINLMSVLQKR